MADKKLRCPNCNEILSSDMRNCKYCGEFITKTTLNKTIDSNISNTEEHLKATQRGNTGCAVGIIGVIAFIIGIIVGDASKTGAFLAFSGIALFVWGIIVTIKSTKKTTQLNDKEEKLRAESFKQDYLAIKNKFNVPNNAAVVQYKNGYADIYRYTNYIWINDGNLHFFPTENITAYDYDKSKVKLYTILLDKIEYYATRGEIVHENKITGGGGGGSSIKGAIVGGAIAGGVGAVIGSRKKSDPIKSELITHDKRETFLNFFDDNNVKHSMFFRFSDYDAFNKLMPEKAFDIVNTIKTTTILNKVVNKSNSTSVPDQIRELAKLKDEGILTEEEFSEKKKALLERMGV